MSSKSPQAQEGGSNRQVQDIGESAGRSHVNDNDVYTEDQGGVHGDGGEDQGRDLYDGKEDYNEGHIDEGGGYDNNNVDSSGT